MPASKYTVKKKNLGAKKATKPPASKQVKKKTNDKKIKLDKEEKPEVQVDELNKAKVDEENTEKVDKVDIGKEEISEEIPELVDTNADRVLGEIKTIRIAESKTKSNKSVDKIVINMIKSDGDCYDREDGNMNKNGGSKYNRDKENDSDCCNDDDGTTKSEAKGDAGEKDCFSKPVEKVSKECVQLAIRILEKIDPKRKLKKEEVVVLLKEYKHQENDLVIIQAIEYLLDSFENLEEKLEELEEYRVKQEKLLKAKRLDKKVFHDRINLDLAKEERDPDENDRIYMTGKKIFSGNNQRYKKAKTSDLSKFKKAISPKKNAKLLKQFNI